MPNRQGTVSTGHSASIVGCNHLRDSMAWSLFNRKKTASPLSIEDAIVRLTADPSAESRNRLYGTLKSGRLFLAANDIPKAWGPDSFTLEQATKIAVLTSSAPGGGEALLAFTSHGEATRRNPSIGTFAMEALDVLRLVLSENLSALVLNPAGPWAGIPAADIRSILGENS